MIPHRRAMALVTVLLVIAIGAMIGLSAMYRADADVSGAAWARRASQSRAMAWSGVQAVMVELAAQRESLIAGGAPKLTPSWALAGPGARRGPRGMVWRIRGELPAAVVSESTRINVNTATTEMLQAAPGVGDAAAAIVAARNEGGRRLSSVWDLVRRGAIGPDAVDATAVVADPADASTSSSVLTVFGFDPQVQGTEWPDAPANAGIGKKRVNIAARWSDELGRALDERVSAAIAGPLKTTLAAAKEGDPPGSVVDLLRRAGVPQGRWGEALDCLCIGDDEFAVGRIDVNRADAAVLACIPGIGAQLAGAIVDHRLGMDESTKRDPAWPLSAGIVSVDVFERAAPYLTVRSLQWRVVIEAGVEPPDQQPAAERDVDDLEDRVILEAVLDVSGETPRVAYLRDITLADTARALADLGLQTSEPRDAENSLERSDATLQPPRSPSADKVRMNEAPKPDPGYRQGGSRPASGRGSGAGQSGLGRIGRWTTGGVGGSGGRQE